MKNNNKYLFFFISVISIIIVFSACPITVENPDDELINVNINIRDIEFDGFSPPVDDITITKYIINGEGPNSDSFGPISSTNKNVSIPELSLGEWNIRVDGYNNSDEKVASISKSVVITSETSSLGAFQLNLLSGYGDFSLAIKWPQYMALIDDFSIVLSPNSGGSNIVPSSSQITTNDGIITKNHNFNSLLANDYSLQLKIYNSVPLQLSDTINDEIYIYKDMTSEGIITIDSIVLFNEQELYAPSREDLIGQPQDNENFFGKSISVDGNMAVICDNREGPSFSNHYGLQIGSAHIYTKDNETSNWEHSVRLTSEDQENEDLFGFSSCISGDRVIIGAPDHTNDNIDQSGAAFIFTYDSNSGEWDDGVKIVPSDTTEYDRFGYSVAIYGDTAIVGTKNAASSNGSVYVFNYDIDSNEWNQSSKIEGAVTDYYFGQSLAMIEDTCIIGGSGFAYILNKSLIDNWALDTRLDPSDVDTSTHEFGYDVDICDNYLIVGAPSDSQNAGRAYIYNLEGALQQRVDADNGSSGTEFGSAVTISDDIAVVGDYRSINEDVQNGGTYIYKKDSGGNWSQISKLYSSDTFSLDAFGDCFGLDLSIDGDTLFVSACMDDYDESDTGSAYVYKIP